MFLKCIPLSNKFWENVNIINAYPLDNEERAWTLVTHTQNKEQEKRRPLRKTSLHDKKNIFRINVLSIIFQ